MNIETEIQDTKLLRAIELDKFDSNRKLLKEVFECLIDYAREGMMLNEQTLTAIKVDEDKMLRAEYGLLTANEIMVLPLIEMETVRGMRLVVNND